MTICRNKCSEALTGVGFGDADVASVTNLDGLELGALLHDLFGVSVGGLVDLQQPGGLRQRPQSVDGVGALEVALVQPFL